MSENLIKTSLKKTPLKKTPLFDLHISNSGKMVDFADYSMPINYPMGVKEEHIWTRTKSGLFDVSHMGQAWLIGENQEDVSKALERLLPAEIQGMGKGKQQYTQLLNEDGGILDDLIISKPLEDKYNDRLYMVVNAGCKENDYDFIAKRLGDNVKINRLENRALVALQGPKAVSVLSEIINGVEDLKFMSVKEFFWNNGEKDIDLLVSRSGYTGEDGFEISIGEKDASNFAKEILRNESVKLIGLGARDSLRLEAGLCLYGNDLDESTSPIEAGLIWSIGKRRREEGGFIGEKTILEQIDTGASKKRIGLDIDSRVPCRRGVEIFSKEGERIGEITSGGFSPCLEKPIAMGYVLIEFSSIDTEVVLKVRSKEIDAKVCKMPFVKQGYVR